MAPTTSMYELTGITFELRKGGRELDGACRRVVRLMDFFLELR